MFRLSGSLSPNFGGRTSMLLTVICMPMLIYMHTHMRTGTHTVGIASHTVMAPCTTGANAAAPWEAASPFLWTPAPSNPLYAPVTIFRAERCPRNAAFPPRVFPEKVYGKIYSWTLSLEQIRKISETSNANQSFQIEYTPYNT